MWVFICLYLSCVGFSGASSQSFLFRDTLSSLSLSVIPIILTGYPSLFLSGFILFASWLKVSVTVCSGAEPSSLVLQ